MQQQNEAFAATDFVSQADYDAANVKPVTPDAPKPANRAERRANASNAKRRVNSKAAKQAAPATPAKPAKPTQADRLAAQAAQADALSLARQAARKAVSEFYSGRSLPFKAAGDRFADLNFANAKAATPRQAGLMLALITYGAGNMLSTGEFIRGEFRVPARLINPNAKPSDTIRAQPESGCFGNMLGRAADYVSGPKAGREQAAAVYRLRPAVALAEIQATFGDKLAKQAAKLLAGFPAKRAA